MNQIGIKAFLLISVVSGPLYAQSPQAGGPNSAKLGCAYGAQAAKPSLSPNRDYERGQFLLLGSTAEGADQFLILPTKRGTKRGFYIYGKQGTYFLPAPSVERMTRAGYTPTIADGRVSEPWKAAVDVQFTLPGETKVRSFSYSWSRDANDPKPHYLLSQTVIGEKDPTVRSIWLNPRDPGERILEVTDHETEEAFQTSLSRLIAQYQAYVTHSFDVNSTLSKKRDLRDFAVARVSDCLEAASPRVKQEIETTIAGLNRLDRGPTEWRHEPNWALNAD